jgi:hypothetical protein
MSISNGFKGVDVPVTVSDSTASKYRFMQVDATDTSHTVFAVKAATADTTAPIGILQIPTTYADECSTLRMGETGKLEVNGNSVNIAGGDKLVSAAGGIGVGASAVSATQQEVGAIACEPSTADGDIITVKIVQFPLVKGTA